MSTAAFVHLRLHTEFSLQDSVVRIPELVERAAALGYPALALLDRDGVYGLPRFHQAAKAAGIRAIVGAELTVAPTLTPPGL